MIYGFARLIKSIFAACLLSGGLYWLVLMVLMQLQQSHNIDRLLENREIAILALATAIFPFMWKIIR